MAKKRVGKGDDSSTATATTTVGTQDAGPTVKAPATLWEQFLDLEMFDEVRRMTWRQLAMQVLNFLMIIFSALMIWKGLMVWSGSESPIVVVLSGSMEPAFQRGDLLFLANDEGNPIRVGEILVFKVR